MKKFLMVACALLTGLFAVPVLSYAACSTPTGQEGDMIFNESARVLQWCDGTTWYAAGQIDPAGPNDGCLDPVGVGGDIVYNSTEHLLQYCDGDHWQGIGGGDDIIPDGFTFADLTNQTQSSTVSSNIVTINGIDSPADVTISGEGTPQFRINGGSWVTSGTITNGQTLQLRLTTAAALSTTHTATVVVGTVDAEWSASTVGSDTTPNSFTFTDRNGITPNTLTTSNTITITGINSSTAVSVSGAGAQISINGGAWVTSGSISNGQTLQVRLTSSSSTGTTLTATVTVGGVSDSWAVTTSSAGYYIVQTSGTWNGNLGGISGANAKCLSDLQANSWLGKSNVTLNANTVKAWVCDWNNGCPSFKLGTNYKFAKSGSPATGGADLAISATGSGPGNTTLWNGSTYFGSTTRAWSGMTNNSSLCATSSTAWSGCSSGVICTDWTASASGQNGAYASPSGSGDTRWGGTEAACNNLYTLYCIVTDNGGGDGNTGRVEVISTDTDFLESSTSTFTFNNMSIGPASSNRMVVAMITGRRGSGSGTTISSVTIGGVAATEARKDSVTNSGVEVSGIYTAMIPSGTTANVVVNYSASLAASFVTLVSVKGVSSNTYASRAGNTAASGTTLSLTGLSVPANGILFAVGAANSEVTASVSGVAERIDQVYALNAMHVASWSIFPNAQSGKTISYTYTGGSRERITGSAASFGP